MSLMEITFDGISANTTKTKSENNLKSEKGLVGNFIKSRKFS